MRFRMTWILGVLALFSVCFAVIWVVINVFGDPLNLRAFRDKNLMATFVSHRDSFEKIRLMSNQDEQKGWFIGVSKMSDLDETRQREYRNQICLIQSGLDVRLDGNGNVLRYIFSGGSRLLAIGPGWVKGIEYIPTDYNKQGILVTNTDEMRKAPEGVYLRQIGPNWFIFYQKTD